MNRTDPNDICIEMYVVGLYDGRALGVTLGRARGLSVGRCDGLPDGENDDGFEVGCAVGM
jgi:hypothetical protein